MNQLLVINEPTVENDRIYQHDTYGIWACCEEHAMFLLAEFLNN